MIRFTPDFAPDEDVARYLFHCTDGSRYGINKTKDSDSNVLSIFLGDTTVHHILVGTYSPYWNVNQENTLIITGDDTNNLTNIWLNGNQILTNDSTAWANADPATLYIGARFTNTARFNGEIRDFMVWNRLLTAEERAILDARAYVNPLYEGLVFCAPMTDDYLEGTGRPSDISSAGNHCSVANGTPTYSSAGVELDGSTEDLEFPSTGVFNSDEITIAIRFTPDFDTDADNYYSIFDVNTPAANYRIIKYNNANSNILDLRLGGTIILYIPEATYSPYWNVGVENIIIITGDATNSLTNVWLNGNQIVTNNSTPWTNTDPAALFIGSGWNNAIRFDGEIRDFAVWNRILTANERAQYENSTEGAII